MRIEQLKYFIDIAQTKSFNTSAERLFLTQPSISDAIKKLEEELNCPLFTRTRQGVELTAAGTTALKWATQIVSNIENMQEDVYQAYLDDCYSTKSGSLTIGATRLADTLLLGNNLTHFSQKHPEIKLKIYEYSLPMIRQALISDKVELGVFTTYYQHELASFKNGNDALLAETDELYVEKIYSEPIFALAPKSYDIARKKVVSLKDILQYPQVVFSGQYANGDKFLYHFLKQYGEINPVVQGTNLSILRNAVLSGRGIGLFTKSGIKYQFENMPEALEQVKILRFEEDFGLGFYLLGKKQTRKNNALQDYFIMQLKNSLKI